jgi:tRNA-splicing ligase RtcB
MVKESYHGPLERVDETCWRIPKSYRPGMRVDGLIFADDRLVEQIKKDQAPDQVANVATLPGIQHASLAMPDIHWGYGFCIGGVCATDPDEGGVISPGGVGYDINCLPGDSHILHALGYTRAIGDMAEDWRSAELACFDLERSRRQATLVRRWFGQKPRQPVLRMVTESGDVVRATADHPFWTPDGMVPLGRLKPGDTVGLAPFQGIPFEQPSDDIILTEGDVRATLAKLKPDAGGARQAQVLRFLKERALLPLGYSSPALPYLCKVLGYVFGDGNIHFVGGGGKGVVSFWGRAKDLEAIRADIDRLGVTPSRVYSRNREHAFETAYADVQFNCTEEWFKVVGTGFSVLLAGLGAPVGNKASQDYDVPAWLARAPLWQQRLFLAALFGAELTTPASISGHGTLLIQPVLGMNKKPNCVASGKRFLKSLSILLARFGVETQSILLEPPISRGAGTGAQRLRLVLSTKIESQLNLWNRIGYEYNARRTGLASLAVQYLKHKRNRLNARVGAHRRIRAVMEAGVGPRKAAAAVASAGVNFRFVERSLYAKREFTPRIGEGFPTFEEFCASHSARSSLGGPVWERIASIKPVEDFDGEVYDFTVAHRDHNFVANGFVVSNCGVRLVRSNLTFKEVRPHVRPLVDELFRQVPTGAGKSGKYHFDPKELKQLMALGPRYVQGRGLASDSDIEHTEGRGRLDGADPDEVSDRALARGAEQCGTLGSGNHFLEVQVVDAIFDEQAARVMGLEKDQVCVMIHSGSRGLGYQVCDDALAMLRKAPEKYGISLPDRQLACAPVNSPEGQRYLGTMRAAANFAWCNRQLLMWQAREVFARIFGRPWQELQMSLIYDVCHNIAKLEEHTIGGKKKRVWVHRKGATRAFPPGHPEVPAQYRAIGQPVIIPGDMGRASWVLVGQPGSMEKTFGTTCHGAGRAMSRTAAVKDAAGRRIDRELEAQGIIARAQSRKGLAEEQPKAYKNVDEVVEVVHRAGLSKKVARLRPIGVIKG